MTVALFAIIPLRLTEVLMGENEMIFKIERDFLRRYLDLVRMQQFEMTYFL